MNRRRFLNQVPTLSAMAGLASCASDPGSMGISVGAGQSQSFAHGVASGDPLANAVILWTHVRPSSGQGDVPSVAVKWRVAKDQGMQQTVAQGNVSALASRDFTVKVDVQGLAPDSYYYYQFEAQSERSPVGRTRTLAATGLGDVRMAVASCANYPFGHFNVYRRIAERDDLNVVVHLGDYLYEYAPGTYDGKSTTRAHFPPREIVALADYRMRHAQYKRDPDLQAAHQQHPWICVWDDHESTNNSWLNGAENHNPGEGEWSVRKQAAIRAYHEWMPIREQSASTTGAHIYRSFQFGDTADLLMLDTRLHGRSEQVDRLDTKALQDPSRTLLGADQLAWMQAELQGSKARGARWRVLGQQCMLGQLLNAQQQVLNADQWDGYPIERKQILDHLQQAAIDNTVVLTGDIHSSWAMDVTQDAFGGDYNPDTGKGSVAVELVTSAVTSPSPYGTVEQAAPRELERMQDPHIHWVNFQKRGYLVVDLTAERALAQWWLVDNVASVQHRQTLAKSMVTASGTNHLVDA